MKSSRADDLVAAPAPEQRTQPPEPEVDEPTEVEEPAPEQEPALEHEPALDQREREILAFEGKWWKHAGAKEQAIRDAFDLSATRYYQVLNALLDNPAALAHDPVLVGRLRRLRSTRARSRTGRA
jgi:hypothetical protein